MVSDENKKEIFKNNDKWQWKHNHSKSTLACLLSCSSCVQLCATLWTIASQTPLSMGFSRQENWSRLPRPPTRDPPNPRIELTSLMSPALAGRFFTTNATWEAYQNLWDAAKTLLKGKRVCTFFKNKNISNK